MHPWRTTEKHAPSLALATGAYTMRQRVPLFSLLSICFALLAACVLDENIRQDIQGSPMHGWDSYTAELRAGDMRDGTVLRTGALFVAHGKLRYEMKGTEPLEYMVLLARLDAGQAWLVNPANNNCLEGSFTPQRWMDIGYLLAAFPKVMQPRIIASKEEVLGKEMLSGYKTGKIRRTGRHMLFGEEKDFTETLWLAEEFCIPLRHEDGIASTELTKIRKQAVDASLFTLPAACRKVASFAELLQQ